MNRRALRHLGEGRARGRPIEKELDHVDEQRQSLCLWSLCWRRLRLRMPEGKEAFVIDRTDYTHRVAHG